MNKNLIRVAGILTGVAGSAAAALAYLYRRPLPKTEGTMRLSGLRRPVEVIRDRWGVPHIYAENSQDLFFAQGYVHAQDRLWQMEFNRRIGHGRLSEIFGAIAFDTDALLRTIGLGRAARNDLEVMDPDTRGVLEAYTLGVNTFVGSNRNRLPLEFTLLGFKPAPWEPTDSLAWGKMMGWGLSGNWDSEILHALLIQRLGVERAARLQGEYHPDNPLIFQDHTLGDILKQMQEEFDSARDWLPVGGMSGASNSWIVDGDKSITGKPLMANDPHLTIQIPSLWYEIHLNSPEIEVTGVSLPGAPGVVIGHNRDLTWGLTASFADVQDVYIEKFNPDNALEYEFQGKWEQATVLQEGIKVKGEALPRVVEITVTRHGPIINDLAPLAREHRLEGLALRWSAHEPSQLFRAVLNLNRARNWNEFAEALRYWDCPSMNFQYADREGNIGYHLAGRIPVRAKGNGLTPVPGWTGEYEWTGWIPHEELPQALNPASHYIASANNLIVGKEYPYFITAETQNGYRARRISERLAAQEKSSHRDFASMQVDQFCRPAEEFCYLLREWGAALIDHPALADVKAQAAAALDHIRGWDYNLTADSVAGAVYKTTQYFAMRRVFEPWLGNLTDHYLGNGFAPVVAEHIIYYVDYAPLVLQRILMNNESDWFKTAAGEPLTREDILAGSLKDAIAFLRKAAGDDIANWQWGKVHPISFDHPLGQVKPLDKIFCRGPYPFGGDANTVWQSVYNPKLPITAGGQATASWRQIIDLGDWDASLAVCTSGQSGHPASKHYADFVELWRTGEYHPMLWSREQVDRNAEARLRLEP